VGFKMANKAVIPVNDLAPDDGSQIIDAIRTGCVDAFVVEEREGHAVYTVDNADLPYSTLVQRMQQGAAMVNSTGHIIYCNPSLAELLGTTGEALVGHRFDEVIAVADRPVFQTLLDELQNGSREGEFHLRRTDDSVIPARLSLTTLYRDKSILGVLVSDLTSEKSYADLASRIQSLQDEERKRIARELHDSVGQLLTALAMNISRLQKEGTNSAAASADLLSDCGVMIDQVSREIRTISHLLHPPLLDVAGLSSAIRWYVDGFSHRSKIEVDLQIDSDLGRLPAEIEITLFRVVQECLTNVYRHSGSDFCSISVRLDAQRLFMEIRDTGHGMRDRADGEISSGVGLRGMQERLRRLGGTLQIQSSEKGTTVRIEVALVEKLELQSSTD
jgi:two-component system, NarL family, sensor kinase